MDSQAPKSQYPLCDAFIAKPYSLDDLLLRIAEILRLELTYRETSVPDVKTSAEFTPEERKELIELARNGMARALTDRIGELAKKGSLRAPMLARLNKMASVFDLPGIADILEEISDAAE